MDVFNILRERVGSPGPRRVAYIRSKADDSTSTCLIPEREAKPERESERGRERERERE